MIEFREHGVRVRADPDATRRLYATLDAGHSATCDTDHCRYFAQHRTEAFPESFRAGLTSMSIDLAKDGEVWWADNAPWCLYSGGYTFVGTVTPESAPSETFAMRDPDDHTFSHFFSDDVQWRMREHAQRHGFIEVANVGFLAYLKVAFPNSADALDAHEAAYEARESRRPQSGLRDWLANIFTH